MIPRRLRLAVLAAQCFTFAGLSVATAKAETRTSIALPSSDLPTTAPVMLDAGIANPAAEARQPQPPQSQPSDSGFVHPWELPPVQVVGQRPGLREEDRVGTYAQPLWTADRRFAETRVYVRPEGSLQFEAWFIPAINRKGASVFQTQYELEFGLPHRFQLDLYLNPTYTGSGGPTFVNQAFELRYALADWGKIWGNPTLYAEYTRQDQGPDQLESKLLLGGELAPRWHWGADLTYQRDFGGSFTNTYETTGGLSYTLVDSRFDLGVEAKLQLFDVRHCRGHLTDNCFIGPSIQFRPMPRMHIDIVPLVGITHESPAVQAYFVVGWEF